MKFLCIQCDTQMQLKETLRDPENSALSVVFSCPDCGQSTAMLTNPGETQLVQSLGVKIGSEESEGASKCPFSAMLAGDQSAANSVSSGPKWTSDATERLNQVPEFVRPMAKSGIEKYAESNGCAEITVKVLEAARASFGL